MVIDYTFILEEIRKAILDDAIMKEMKRESFNDEIIYDENNNFIFPISKLKERIQQLKKENK